MQLLLQRLAINAGTSITAGSTVTGVAVTGSTSVRGGYIQSDAAIFATTDVTAGNTVSGSGVTAALMTSDIYQNQNSTFTVTSPGVLQASSLSDGIATLTAGSATGLVNLSRASGSGLTIMNSFQQGTNNANSGYMQIYGLTASAATALPDAVNNLLVGDWKVQQGGLSLLGNPNQSTYAQAQPALKLSASSFAGAVQGIPGDAGAFASMPYIQMQGLDHTGTVKEYKLQISGGILQLNVVS